MFYQSEIIWTSKFVTEKLQCIWVHVKEIWLSSPEMWWRSQRYSIDFSRSARIGQSTWEWFPVQRWREYNSQIYPALFSACPSWGFACLLSLQNKVTTPAIQHNVCWSKLKNSACHGSPLTHHKDHNDVCVDYWQMVSVRIVGVMYDHTVFYACKSPDQTSVQKLKSQLDWW